MTSRTFPRYGWLVLGYTAAAAVWGAFVRATGSGAGCGNHWPLCNGEVVPRGPAVETLIELSHRVSSGLVGPLAIVLVVWAVRRFGWRHPASLAAVAALVLTVVEGLIGAALVRFELVGQNASVTRGFVMAAHLVNTFLLLAAMALTAAWGAGWALPRLRRPGVAGWLLGGGLLAVTAVGASGAVTALGDTLFPVATLTEDALRALDLPAQVLVRLRILHPFLAVGAAAYLVVMAVYVRERVPAARVKHLTLGLGAVFGVQLGAGLVNVALAAPVWLQLVHLALAYLVWLLLVLLCAEAAGAPAPAAATGARPLTAPAGRSP
ncbi:MAG: COX15/CtaA family protein [Thermoanaerobaculia bacterium]